MKVLNCSDAKMTRKVKENKFRSPDLVLVGSPLMDQKPLMSHIIICIKMEANFTLISPHQLNSAITLPRVKIGPLPQT